MKRYLWVVAAAVTLSAAALLVARSLAGPTVRLPGVVRAQATTSAGMGIPAARVTGRLGSTFDPSFFGRSWQIRGKIRARRLVDGKAVVAIDAPHLVAPPRRFRDEGRTVTKLGVLVVVPPKVVISWPNSRSIRFADLRNGDVLVITGRFTKPRRKLQVKGGKLVFTLTAQQVGGARPAAAASPRGAPSSSGYPSAENTGVPPGTRLRPSGSITVTSPGTVLDGLDIRGTVKINASNVILRRSRVTVDTWWPVTVAAGLSGVRIEDVEVAGTGGTPSAYGISGPATVMRANIHGYDNGIAAYSGSVIRDSYIHGLTAPAGAHYDGIIVDGEHDVTIEHNTIVNEHDQTSVVMISNRWGPVDNVTVRDNRLLGGGYTVYSVAQFAGGPITGVSFIANRLGRGYWGYATTHANSVVWRDNVDDVTGKAVPAP